MVGTSVSEDSIAVGTVDRTTVGTSVSEWLVDGVSIGTVVGILVGPTVFEGVAEVIAIGE